MKRIFEGTNKWKHGNKLTIQSLKFIQRAVIYYFIIGILCGSTSMFVCSIWCKASFILQQTAIKNHWTALNQRGIWTVNTFTCIELIPLPTMCTCIHFDSHTHTSSHSHVRTLTLAWRQWTWKQICACVLVNIPYSTWICVCKAATALS